MHTDETGRKEKINAEMSRIYGKFGMVKPSIVVKEATSKRSPIHDEFEWDNDKAGHKYRLIQARTLIRVARVTFLDDNGEEQKQQLFHIRRIQQQDDSMEGEYKPASVIVKNVDEFTLAMNEVLVKLGALQHAVDVLQAAANSTEKDDGILGRIAVALQAMETANNALRPLH